LRLKILKKLRTASLNSKFTGSYKKKVHIVFAGVLQKYNFPGAGYLTLATPLQFNWTFQLHKLLLFNLKDWTKTQ